jgi:hypothetical protein
MVVKNLEFFDRDGYNLNLNWNEEKHIWEGNIFFPRVSVGLYRNTTIYVIEYSGYDSDYTDDVYTYPTGEGNITFQWDIANNFVDEFFMFDFDEDYEIKDTSSLIHTPYDGPVCEPLIVNRFEKYSVPLLGSSENIEQDDLLEIHVAFMANEKSAETTYKRTLILSYENGYTNYEIARITFFAETIEEDERLKIWNENLGYNLKLEDTIIFKHSDIHEYMPDFEILNEKRKELMLEGHNIYPFIGSYRAIINMIKFFGYDNLNIVEYWENINSTDADYGKLYRTYVYGIKNKKTFSTKRKPISLDTKNFKKLSNISLVYNINHTSEVDGKKYDEYGLPNVIEDFDKDKRDDFLLTIEEALVKMFALKKKLNDEFMPVYTNITDIIGEGNYFGINLIGNNSQISTINYVESKGYVDFSVYPNKYCYITENEDFAKYIAEIENLHIDKSINELGDKTIKELEKEYDDINNSGDININEIDKRSLGTIINDFSKNGHRDICDYYKKYISLTLKNRFGDAKEYGLREEPEPRNVYKDNVLDDVINDTYGDNENVPDMTISAKVILRGTINENMDITSIIEWRVIHPETGWTVTYSGDVNNYIDVFVQLPYLGNYDVEMSVWDKYNHCCKQYTQDAIIVEPYNIDIKGFYYDARPLPDTLKYDLVIPHKYRDDIEVYKYYLWSTEDGKRGYVSKKRNPMDMVLSDIICRYKLDDEDDDIVEDWISINNADGDEILKISYFVVNDDDKERWESIVNNNDDGIDVLKISWCDINYKDDKFSYGIEEYKYAGEFVDYDGKLNDNKITLYSPEWNGIELYKFIKKNVDKMYLWALQEHLGDKDINSTMRNYRPDGSVSFKGPYYKYDVDNILYKADRGYKEYEHLNAEIVNLEPGEHYKYVRYINSVVDIKPLTWVLLGFDDTRITGRIVNEKYPKWTLTMVGDSLDPDDELSQDKIITTHNGLYFTYLFEEEGVYKIKLELMDINGNKYETERPIVIVDKDANYEMYHSLKNEYDKFLDEKYERYKIYEKIL